MFFFVLSVNVFQNVLDYSLTMFIITLNVHGEGQLLLHIFFCAFDNTILRIQFHKSLCAFVIIIFGKFDSTSFKLDFLTLSVLWFPYVSFAY